MSVAKYLLSSARFEITLHCVTKGSVLELDGSPESKQGQNWHDRCLIRSFRTLVRLPVAECTHKLLSKNDEKLVSWFVCREAEVCAMLICF